MGSIWENVFMNVTFKKYLTGFGVLFHVGGKLLSFMDGTDAGNMSILEHHPELGQPQHRKEGNCWYSAKIW